ncbi:hypothetical protein SAMN04489713_112254 [Actinomadura madurae]|uniref:Uncharacterized protein n=1 Tax=Actinomadura madurae TaxID=1993 RepID=A0A1I5NQW8_9ACTN|nr:hypothetical protein [Actinomadura madurae]SFP24050.1 hypothetical protein SAMN04489713_112254 [Actinomadura madurae]
MNERRDRGEGAVAYVAVLCVGATVVATLVSGVGERISGSIGAATCRLVQDGGCEDGDAPATRPVPSKELPPTIYCVQAPCPQPTTSPTPSPQRKPGGTIYCFRAPCPQPTPGRPTFGAEPTG